jgi:two-component system response regulator HydG
VRAVADRIVSIVTTMPRGWAVWRPSPDESRIARAAVPLARDRLSALGFAIVRPGVTPCSDCGQMLHRHVALFCFDERDRREAARWVSRLSRASARSHVLIDLAGPRRAVCQTDERGTGDDVEAIDRCLDRLELDRAESRLSGLATQAALEGRAVSAALRARVGALRFWQGRFDATGDWAFGNDADVCGWAALHAWASGDRERRRAALARLDGGTCGDDVARAFWRRAHAVLTTLEEGGDVAPECEGLRNLAPSSLRRVAVAIEGEAAAHDAPRAFLPPHRAAIRRNGAYGFTRWGIGRISMQWLHVMPALLEIVRDAEDDLAAMSGACRWLVRHAGAARVVIVDGARQRWLAGEGWTRADWIRQPGLPGDVVVAAVRYRGESIAQVAAARGADKEPALQPAVEAVAVLLAPAVRGRLDALSASSRAREGLVPELIGRSPSLAGVREEIVKAAAVPFPVLVEGESGTGKELVARAIHRLSPRRDRRFCAVNCAALSDDLVEAELFGHARGAFTGAVATRPGLFEEAHAGTLFLDEVGELSPRAQAKLLRAVQEREVRRVGENSARPVDVRLVAATNVAMQEAVGAGRFRTDLHFRLAVVRISLPPLRDRLEDIPLLAEAFWRQLTSSAPTRARLGPDALAVLSRHSWPGNVRELQNAIAALVTIAPDRGRVGARHVRQVLGASASEAPWTSLTAARRTVEQRAIATALARHAGRRTAAARELGLSRQGLAKAIKRLGLGDDERATGVA